MSSAYRVLCLNHDPAIDCGPEWHTPGEALAAVADLASHEQLAAHASCDLLIGRYSYPLIEVCCPVRSGGLSRHGGNIHSAPKWVDVEWLRLLYIAGNGYHGKHVKDAVKAAAGGCWALDRVNRLRLEMGFVFGEKEAQR